MKGDFTRDTFLPAKHYQQVLMQQGRVQLDADWNEQAAIAAYRDQTTAQDILGHCGGPAETAAFAVFTDPARLTVADRADLQARFGALAPASQPVDLTGAAPTCALRNTADFFLSAGRYYVAGIQCENNAATPYTAQPDRPPLPPLPDGTHLLYLDVWRRHLTALDDPAIRESALSGPDTATRVKTVWQVRAVPHNPPVGESACAAANPAYATLTAASTGRLRARTQEVSSDDDPCQLPETAGYKGLENQLYRVEIHQGSRDADGNVTSPTWKWSRENGSVVTSITRITNLSGKGVITVASLGRDEATAFRKGAFVEVLDDALELEGQPGQLLEIESFDNTDPDNLTLTLVAPALPLASGPAFPKGIHPARHPKLRRWEGRGNVSDPNPHALESGIQIEFESAAAVFRTGDYWLIPARTATADAPAGDIEWPRRLDAFGQPIANQPLLQLPLGVQHHYCRLAVVTVTGGVVAALTDCRCLWPLLNTVPRLFYVSGDGQEVMPDLSPAAPPRFRLPRPLVVGVANAHCLERPLAVQFEVVNTPPTSPSNGWVAPHTEPATTPAGPLIVVPLDADGLAACDFHLDGINGTQQVTARLLDATGQPVSLPLRFNANLSIASQVAYTAPDCAPFAAVRTVAGALDRLRELLSLYPVTPLHVRLDPGVNSAPLTVLAANRCGARDGVDIAFVVLSGPNATVAPAATTTGPPTDATGQATAICELLPEESRAVVLATLTNQELLDRGAEPTRVLFVIERAPEAAVEPGVRIVSLRLRDPQRGLRLDDQVDLDEFRAGLLLGCDRRLDPQTVADAIPARGQPTCFVTVEVPFPLTPQERSSWNLTTEDPTLVLGAAFRPFVLGAVVDAMGPGDDGEPDRLRWLPTPEAAAFLERVFRFMSNAETPIDRLLARLTLKGNFIFDLERRLYLDGDTYRSADRSSSTGLREEAGRISGDHRRGGDFEVWFWLVRAQAPVITVQPQPGIVFVGGPFEFRVVASNARSYQWFRNGDPISGAVQPRYHITATGPNDAGDYRVEVRNERGSILSNEVALRIVQRPDVVAPGGRILFTNRLPASDLDVPVLDEAGTRLASERFQARLMVGQEVGALAPVGEPAPLRRGSASGYWAGGEIVLPFPPGSRIVARVRLWDMQAGDTYEAALATGRGYGESNDFIIEVTSEAVPPQPAAALVGLASFRFRR